MYLMWLIQSQEIRYGPYGHCDLLLQPNRHWLIVERRVLIFRVEVSIIIGFIQMLTLCRVWFSFRKRFQQGSGPGTVKLHDACTGLSHLRFPIELGTRKDSLFLRYLVKSWFNHLIPAVSDTLMNVPRTVVCLLCCTFHFLGGRWPHLSKATPRFVHECNIHGTLVYTDATCLTTDYTCFVR